MSRLLAVVLALAGLGLGLLWWLTLAPESFVQRETLGLESRAPSEPAEGEPLALATRAAATEVSAPAQPAPEQRTQVQSPAQTRGQELAPQVLVGRVLDFDARPAAGARVLLMFDRDWQEAPLDAAAYSELGLPQMTRLTTEADGGFRFEGYQPRADGQRPRLCVLWPGATPLEDNELNLPQPDAQGLRDLGDLRLKPGAILRGHVLDLAGKPVAKVHLCLSREQGNPFGRLDPAQQRELALTDADGSFEVLQLAPGASELILRHDDYPSRRQLIDAVAGEQAAALVWRLGDAGEIRGRVVASAGQELGGLWIVASPILGDAIPLGEIRGEARFAQTDAEGQFTVRGVEPGLPHNLRVNAKRPGLWESEWRSKPQRAQAGDQVRLELQAPRRVHFQVADLATGQPLEDFRIHLSREAESRSWSEETDPSHLLHDAQGQWTYEELKGSSGQETLSVSLFSSVHRRWTSGPLDFPESASIELGLVQLEPLPLTKVRVLDAHTGAPIAKAVVALVVEPQVSEQADADELGYGGDSSEQIQWQSFSALTDEQGLARIAYERGVGGELWVSHADYASDEPRGLVFDAAGRLPQEYEFELDPGASALVRVLDLQGEPVPDIGVEHAWAGATYHAWESGPANQGNTDAQGECRFERLTPGVHRFRVAVHSARPSFFMGSAGEKTASEWATLELENGSEKQLELLAPRTLTVAGQLLEAGLGLEGAKLTLTDPAQAHDWWWGEVGPTTVSKGDGQFVFRRVKPGSYKLLVEHPQRALPYEQVFEFESDPRGLVIDLPACAIRGRVVDERGAPIEGAEVRAQLASEGQNAASNGPQIYISMGDDQMFSLSAHQGQVTHTDAQGSYLLRGCLPGVDLLVQAGGGHWIAAWSEAIQLAPNGTRSAADIVLRRGRDLLLKLRRASGDPAAQLQVRLERVAAAGEPAEQRFESADEAGNARFTTLSTGRWRASALGGPAGADGEPTFTAPMEFSLEPGDQPLEVELSVP